VAEDDEVGHGQGHVDFLVVGQGLGEEVASAAETGHGRLDVGAAASVEKVVALRRVVEPRLESVVVGQRLALLEEVSLRVLPDAQHVLHDVAQDVVHVLALQLELITYRRQLGLVGLAELVERRDGVQRETGQGYR